MSDFDFVSIPQDEIDNCPEPEVVREEAEVLLEVIDVNYGTDKNDCPYFMPKFKAVEHEDTKPFTKYFKIPTNDMARGDRNNTIRAMRYYYQAFGIDYSSGTVTTEMQVGQQGWALLKVVNNDEYGEQNAIKKFVMPAGN